LPTRSGGQYVSFGNMRRTAAGNICAIKNISSFFKGYFTDGRSPDLIMKPDIVFITIDTLRADHLGCYGYKRNTSPNIDRLAENGILFENAIAQAPWTIPSIASMLTSKFPPELGMIEKNSAFDGNQNLISSILQKNGYETAGFVSCVLDFLTPQRGFAKGFDHYIGLEETHARAEVINRHAFEWIDRRTGNKPMFMWMHYCDVHSDYNAPEPFKNSFTDKEIDRALGRSKTLKGVLKGEKAFNAQELEESIVLYDQEILYTDHHIGKLIDKIKESENFENTLIIIGADHGEEFLEHGGVLHQTSLYDELLRAPLIFHCPKSLPGGERISNQVQNMDIAPTLLEFCRIPGDPEFRGQSLMPLMQGKSDSIDGFAFSHLDISSFNMWCDNWKQSILRTVYMARSNEEKLIYEPLSESFEYYDLREDPEEQHDLFNQKDLESHPIKNALLNFYKQMERRPDDSQKMELERETLDRLEALGYID